MWTSFSVWERGGEDGDDKFHLGTAYGRTIYPVAGAAGYYRLVVERFIHDSGRQYSDGELAKAIPLCTIACDWNPETKELETHQRQLETSGAQTILHPLTELENNLCWFADTVGVLITRFPPKPNEYHAWIPGLEKPIRLDGPRAVFNFIQHLPITVDVPALLKRPLDVHVMFSTNNIDEQARAMAQLNTV